MRKIKQDGATAEELAAAKLETADGISGGEVFTYEGKPSWIFVVVRAPVGDGVYQITGTVHGASTRLGVVRVSHGKGDWGGTTSADMSSIAEIRVVDQDGQQVLHGTVHHE